MTKQAHNNVTGNLNIKKDLTCTRCHDVKEMYCQIVYSQGDKVCLDCKKETQASDNAAFDRYMDNRN